MDEAMNKHATYNEQKQLALHAYVTSIDTAKKALYSLLDEILSCPFKDYKVTLGSRRYRFFNPIIEGEKKQQRALRNTFINRLIKECFAQMVNGNPDAWEPVLAFTRGVDIEAFQLQKVDGSSVEQVQETTRSKALNLESVYVQWQDQNKFGFKEEENV